MIGSGISEAFSLLGNWYTCNYGCTVPEQLGRLYTFDAANDLGVTLPTKDQFESINNSSNCSYTCLTVHGQQGVVIKAARGFLFLPAQKNDFTCNYWSSTEFDNSIVYYFRFFSSGGHSVSFNGRNKEYAVRPIQN